MCNSSLPLEQTLPVTDQASTTYSSSGINFSETLMSVDGVGTILDLSSVTSLDTSFDDGQSFNTRRHTITATNGGMIDLSGVTAITPPARSEDIVQFVLSDDQSMIDLSGLETISGTGGRTWFDLSNGAMLDLPSLTTVEDVQFFLTTGANLTSNDQTSTTYSSSGINFSETLMSVDGENTHARPIICDQLGYQL